MKCEIEEMLSHQKRRHISFHTPGHKRAGKDITELSYSDNLYAPHSVIARAERDAAEILGANRSFLLTDGSTCGVFSMIACLKMTGKRRIAIPQFSHPSVFHACSVMEMEPVVLLQTCAKGIPLQPTAEEIESAIGRADALLLTSPDYYGFFAPLSEAREICAREGKPLFIDGAHGSHLHFTEFHAGKFADVWVDGVHKSLPALTQGAVVSAGSEEWGRLLQDSVRLFRTTSPSYPILASVEAALKYPRKEKLEAAILEFKRSLGDRAVKNDDWSKLLIPFGSRAQEAERFLESRGIYPEFNDGNYLMFYFSPCTKERELRKLRRCLNRLPLGELNDALAGQIPIYAEEK